MNTMHGVHDIKIVLWEVNPLHKVGKALRFVPIKNGDMYNSIISVII